MEMIRVTVATIYVGLLACPSLWLAKYCFRCVCPPKGRVSEAVTPPWSWQTERHILSTSLNLSPPGLHSLRLWPLLGLCFAACPLVRVQVPLAVAACPLGVPCPCLVWAALCQHLPGPLPTCFCVGLSCVM